MKKLLIALGIIIIAVIVIVIIKKNKNQIENSNFIIGQAEVSGVSISLLESFPINVSVSVQGEFPDNCTILGDISQYQDDGTKDFIVSIETKRPLDESCAQVITPFTTTFSLNGTVGLPRGTYEVFVNGVRETFTFDVDNYISSVDPLK